MAKIATLRDLMDALIETCLQNDSLNTIISDLKKFFELSLQNEELKNILQTTAFEVDEKKEVISDICHRANLANETENFLTLTCEFNKIWFLINNKDFVISILERAVGRLRAEVTVATSLSDSERVMIKKALDKITGMNVEIITNVDETIIGGIIAKIENKVFDNSIRSDMENVHGFLA